MAAFRYMTYDPMYPHLNPKPSIGNARLAPYVPYIQDMYFDDPNSGGSNSGGGGTGGGGDGDPKSKGSWEGTLENAAIWPYTAFENSNYLPFAAAFATAFLIGPVLEDGNGDALTMGMSLFIGYVAGGAVFFFYDGSTKKKTNSGGSGGTSIY